MVAKSREKAIQLIDIEIPTKLISLTKLVQEIADTPEVSVTKPELGSHMVDINPVSSFFNS